MTGRLHRGTSFAPPFAPPRARARPALPTPHIAWETASSIAEQKTPRVIRLAFSADFRAREANGVFARLPLGHPHSAIFACALGPHRSPRPYCAPSERLFRAC